MSTDNAVYIYIYTHIHTAYIWAAVGVWLKYWTFLPPPQKEQRTKHTTIDDGHEQSGRWEILSFLNSAMCFSNRIKAKRPVYVRHPIISVAVAN